MSLTVGEILKAVRDSRRVSSRQVSHDAGLSPTYLSKVERGAMEPSLQAFARIATVLELNDAEIALAVRLHAAHARGGQE